MDKSVGLHNAVRRGLSLASARVRSFVAGLPPRSFYSTGAYYAESYHLIHCANPGHAVHARSDQGSRLTSRVSRLFTSGAAISTTIIRIKTYSFGIAQNRVPR